MSSEHPYNASDLTSVLQTLSNLTSQGQARLDDQSETPASSGEQQQDKSESTDARQPQSNNNASSSPAIDPATITTWPAALRCVMRTVTQNEETQLRIRGLIRSQHHHERQWWSGREALLKKQAARGQKKMELDAVLQSIGAPIDPKDITTPEEDQTELANYDAKVYKASAQMADALASELRGMGIPFFVLRTSLIQDSSCSERESPTTAQNAVSSPHKNQNQNHHPDASKLTRSELKDLQRRMLELLQDLCKE